MLLNAVKWLLVHADAATHNDVPGVNNPSTFIIVSICRLYSLAFIVFLQIWRSLNLKMY